MRLLRDFHNWELESVTSFLDLIYSHLPRGDGCDRLNWQLNGRGVFDVQSFNKALGPLLPLSL